MLRYGDMAYEQKNYGSAIHFYKMVVDESLKVGRVSSHPYAFSVYTGKSKKVELSDTSTIEEPDVEIDADVDQNEIYATHMVAQCSRLTNNYSQSEIWYVKSLQLNWGKAETEYPLDRYWYATILMNQGNYTGAIEELKTFLLDHENNSADEVTYYKTRANQLIENCKFATSSQSKNLEVSIKKGDSLLNNGSSSFAASYFDDNNILISSARSNSVGDKNRKIESRLLSDIFTMRKTGYGWEGAVALNEPLNTTEHEGAASVGTNKKVMFFTKWYVDNTKKSEILVSNFFVDKWMKPRELGESVNSKGYSSQHPHITNNNTTLFFSSDMPGGQGGMDIWMCKVDRSGRTSDPINLGPSINTPEDEITPFYHEITGVLYFSSKGHQNIGGYDVFKTKFDIFSNFASNVQNMGIPVNSSKNDMYFCFDNSQTNGFLTSNRDECSDCANTHCNQIYTLTRNENKFLLSGTVYDFDTDGPIPFATITVKDVLGEFDPYTFQTDSLGHYEIPMAPDMHIFFKGQKLEYFADANVQSTIGMDESENFNIDLVLQLIPYEEIEIPGILYDYDKATLRPESKVVIDSLIQFLNYNDNLIIEISSHTDENGSDAYNNKLSQKRAESVVNYLIEGGIPTARLVAKGYGESIPIIKNAETEEDHQKNRRTSFRILGEDFKALDKIRPRNN